MGNQSSMKKKYDIKEKLGMGSFATVKRAVRKSDKKNFAVKEIKKAKLSEEELLVVQDEVKIMEKIMHNNCVTLVEMFETKRKVYMVLELLTGGELFDRIVQKGSFSEKEASDLMKTLIEAIKYLHGINIVHRDLKPENLLYDSKADTANIKITDFGLAKYEDLKSGKSMKMDTACGTPGYVAPEVLKSEEYGPQVDMWSMGVILYILLCGFPPFYHESTTVLYKQIKKGSYTFPDPYWSEISNDAKDLVRGLLNVEPKKRFTPDNVLNHPWISGGKASDKNFGDGHIRRMQLIQARMKLRRGVRTIIAVNRFARALKSALEDDNK